MLLKRWPGKLPKYFRWDRRRTAACYPKLLSRAAGNSRLRADYLHAYLYCEVNRLQSLNLILSERVLFALRYGNAHKRNAKRHHSAIENLLLATNPTYLKYLPPERCRKTYCVEQVTGHAEGESLPQSNIHGHYLYGFNPEHLGAMALFLTDDRESLELAFSNVPFGSFLDESQEACQNRAKGKGLFYRPTAPLLLGNAAKLSVSMVRLIVAMHEKIRCRRGRSQVYHRYKGLDDEQLQSDGFYVCADNYKRPVVRTLAQWVRLSGCKNSSRKVDATNRREDLGSDRENAWFRLSGQHTPAGSRNLDFTAELVSLETAKKKSLELFFFNLLQAKHIFGAAAILEQRGETIGILSQESYPRLMAHCWRYQEKTNLSIVLPRTWYRHLCVYLRQKSGIFFGSAKSTDADYDCVESLRVRLSRARKQSRLSLRKLSEVTSLSFRQVRTFLSGPRPPAESIRKVKTWLKSIEAK